MDVMPLLAEGGSFAGSTHLVVERQPRYQRTTAQVELLFLCHNIPDYLKRAIFFERGASWARYSACGLYIKNHKALWNIES